MRIQAILRREATAWLTGSAALCGLIAVAYGLVGWLGVGIVGLGGLMVTTRLALNDGDAVADSGLGSGDVPIIARQREVAASRKTPEQTLADAAERTKQSRVLYLINTIFIAMTALGFGLFVLNQL